ncbi:MAG: RNA ligase, partial [Methanosarcinales archaeon]|nr:RNA ligase [Methanosarcinales archaeon]
VLHCEMVGPHNPYVPRDTYNVESVAFYVFDIRHKGSGIPLPVCQRHELVKQYGLLSVCLFGIYSLNDAAPQIWEIIKRLGAVGREGVVIKDPMMVEAPIKYTCSESNCTDLTHAFSYYHDYGQDFLYSRVVREGFQTIEWDESDVEFKDRCLRLGESMLGSMAETIRKKQHGDDIYEDIQIKTDLKTAREFQRHLRRMGVGALFKEGVKQEDGEYIFQVKKLKMSTNDKTESILSGDVW